MGEKWTYLPYSRGIDPKRLRIGSLVLDNFNPTTGLEKKRFKFMNDEPSQEKYWEEVLKWTGDPEPEEPYSMTFEATHDSSFATVLADTVGFHAEKSGSIRVSIEGLSGRRFEVEEPERFFQKAVYTQPGVEAWIRKQLTISFIARAFNRMRHRSKGWKAPDVWVCTGIQLITGGQVQAGSAKSKGSGGSAALDAGLATGGPPMGQKLAQMEYERNHAKAANSDYGYKDERVWAAQFYRLDIEFGKHPATSVASAADALMKKGGKLERPLKIELYEVEDLGAGAVRIDEGEDEVVEGEVTPEPVAREANIVGLEPLPAEYQEPKEESGSQSSIRVDEKPYAESMEGVNWTEYEKYSRYLDRMAEYDP